MAQYVTVDLLQKRITQERLDHLCPGQNKEEILAFAGELLARAQDLADSYIRKCYILPLQKIPPIVQEWTLCIAEYELYKRGPASNVPEKIRISYEDTLTQLRDLAQGSLQLDPADCPREKVNSSLAIHAAESFPSDPHCMKQF